MQSSTNLGRESRRLSTSPVLSQPTLAPDGKLCLPFHHALYSLNNPNPHKAPALLWLQGFVASSSKPHNMPLTVRAAQVTVPQGQLVGSKGRPRHGAAINLRCPSHLTVTLHSLRGATPLQKGHFHFHLVDFLPFTDLFLRGSVLPHICVRFWQQICSEL